jgi:hypothetical protein
VVTDNGGDDIEHVECGQHRAAFAEGPSIDELLAHMANHNASAAGSLTAASPMSKE